MALIAEHLDTVILVLATIIGWVGAICTWIWKASQYKTELDAVKNDVAELKKSTVPANTTERLNNIENKVDQVKDQLHERIGDVKDDLVREIGTINTGLGELRGIMRGVSLALQNKSQGFAIPGTDHP